MGLPPPPILRVNACDVTNVPPLMLPTRWRSRRGTRLGQKRTGASSRSTPHYLASLEVDGDRRLDEPPDDDAPVLRARAQIRVVVEKHDSSAYVSCLCPCRDSSCVPVATSIKRQDRSKHDAAATWPSRDTFTEVTGTLKLSACILPFLRS